MIEGVILTMLVPRFSGAGIATMTVKIIITCKSFCYCRIIGVERERTLRSCRINSIPYGAQLVN